MITWVKPELFMPVFGTLVGATIPILLGAYIYRRQKRIDWQHEILRDKKLAYKDFILSTHSFELDRYLREDKTTLDRKLSEEVLGNYMVLSLYASDQVAKSAKCVMDVIAEGLDSKKAMDDLRINMREDLNLSLPRGAK